MSTNQLSNDSVINRAQDSFQSSILGDLGRLSILDILVVHCMHHTQEEGDLGS